MVHYWCLCLAASFKTFHDYAPFRIELGESRWFHLQLAGGVVRKKLSHTFAFVVFVFVS